ncbi:MAG: hypothetical protein ABI366_03030 [Ginsengibacter sp.]
MEDKEQPKKDTEIKDPAQHKKNEEAFEQAEEDIEQDPDMDLGDKTDLDEGELARKEGHP